MHRRLPSERRLLKELKSFVEEPPQGIFVDAEKIEQDLTTLVKKVIKQDFQEEQFDTVHTRHSYTPTRIRVESNTVRWIVNMIGAEGTLYDGEQFQLQFKFDIEHYPFNPPEVTFVGPNVPVHPHVYSNGHICLSILTDDSWVPSLNVQSVSLSIMSMLSSCKKKERPIDNTYHVTYGSANPKDADWYCDDDDI